MLNNKIKLCLPIKIMFCQGQNILNTNRVVNVKAILTARLDTGWFTEITIDNKRIYSS